MIFDRHPDDRRPALWDRVARSLLPTHGARANAEEAMLHGRRSRLERAEAAAALEQLPGSPPGP